MSTLYVDRKDIELRYAGGVIEIHEPSGRRGTIPLVGLERVVLHGRVQLSTSVIGACVEAGASVALLGHGWPSCGVTRIETLEMRVPREWQGCRVLQARLHPLS